MSRQDNKEYDFVATLVFLVDRKKVWLGQKQAKIGCKRFNGPGGEFEAEKDKTIEDCAKRETWEECRINVEKEDLKLYAIGYFSNLKDDGKIFVCKVFIFIAEKWKGKHKTTKEMKRHKKFSIYKMPYKRMMVADSFWIPEIFIKRRKIIVHATLKNKQSELVEKVHIVEVQSFGLCK